eukprot:TRINITY_DN43910_c0_g1_i1.p2 TRINITY_DN43910_c0_g1~~TRINITY_DN43910_c0_g1_i1.p2  ORF type:complete len:137 (-),score=28.26 TRINITY_DN43910_c0_g1_i1:85-495(-)
MIRRPPRSTQGVSSAASDVYKRQVHGDSVCILLITLLAGFLLYYFSGSDFSFKETKPGESDEKEVSIISIDDTKSVLEHGDVLFVDSRSKNYYEKSHIKNVVNIPADSHLDYSYNCLLYTSPSPRDLSTSRMPSSA